ncbi:hypothetical protein [Cellulomonas sp. NTE-D12]|uniref:DUF6978 family protein n=1 Tax=Cellulomonas sp. NTE-D12 TaxID=2962632 RepID=UPI0030820494
MNERAIRARLARLPNFRRLTDAEADLLLDDKSLVVNEPVRWGVSRWADVNPTELRMSVRVFNAFGENLSMRGRISIAIPERSHWALGWGDKRAGEFPVDLRRLDLRDDHQNPDGARWRGTTHKHRWSSQDGNRWAYTPTDIPHESIGEGSVCDDDYRAIFESFAAECHVELGPEFRWHDPELLRPTQTDLWEVP